MAFCTHCGTKHIPQANFCTGCGKRVPHSETAAALAETLAAVEEQGDVTQRVVVAASEPVARARRLRIGAAGGPARDAADGNPRRRRCGGRRPGCRPGPGSTGPGGTGPVRAGCACGRATLRRQPGSAADHTGLNVVHRLTFAGAGWWALLDLFRMRSLVRTANEQSARQALQTLHIGAAFAQMPAAPTLMTQPVPHTPTVHPAPGPQVQDR